MNSKFHIFAFATAIVVSLLMFWFSGWGPYFSSALIFIVSGNLFIAWITELSHKKAHTKEYNNSETELGYIRIYFKNTIGLLEIIFYTFLLLFHQVVLVAGWLVIKALWRYDGGKGGVDDDGTKSLSSEESAAAAIFRIGLILSLFVAFGASLLISFSGFISSDVFKAIYTLLKNN